MEKRLILTIVLITIILFAGNLITDKLYPPVILEEPPQTAFVEEAVVAGSQAVSLSAPSDELVLVADDEPLRTILYSNDVYDIAFSNAGATITSLKLKQFIDNKTQQPVELIMQFEDGIGGAFLTYLSSNNHENPLTSHFRVLDEGATGITFAVDLANFEVKEGESQSVRLIKRFEFKDGEYLFKVITSFVALDGLPLPASLTQQGYTIESLPQLGPAFVRVDGRDVYRHPLYLNADKKRTMAKLRNGEAQASDGAMWAGIVEKYFLLVGVPHNTSYAMGWTSKPLNKEKLPGMQVNFTQKSKDGRFLEFSDEIFYYMGPKQESQLLRYNLANDNTWGVEELYLNRAMDAHVILGIIISPLKWVLTLIYGFVGNWGWAIVILTVLVKLALLKPSLSSAVSMASMSKVQPKLKALQEKYKDNKEELAKKQMELYQQEGVNPAGGCLPMLIQLPILFALFSLFNQYFELRGAPWILWVQDLSSPDKFITFSKPLGLAFLPNFAIEHINLLPILYVLTQMLSTILTMKDNSANSNPQMKMMMIWMPLIFFFMLYNMPSGLFLYWTVSNILGIFQQLLINYWRKNGTLDKMQAQKDAKRKEKGAKQAKMMAAYQQRLNQSKGKNK